MRALIRGSLALAALVALAACGGGQSEPVVTEIGVHRVGFVVPEGFVHYDHGREHRLERTEGDLVLSNYGWRDRFVANGDDVEFVTADDFLDDGKPQPGSFAFGRIVGVKDLIQLITRYAGAGVADG